MQAEIHLHCAVIQLFCRSAQASTSYLGNEGWSRQSRWPWVSKDNKQRLPQSTTMQQRDRSTHDAIVRSIVSSGSVTQFVASRHVQQILYGHVAGQNRHGKPRSVLNDEVLSDGQALKLNHHSHDAHSSLSGGN